MFCNNKQIPEIIIMLNSIFNNVVARAMELSCVKGSKVKGRTHFGKLTWIIAQPHY